MGILRSIDIRYSERPLRASPEDRFQFILDRVEMALSATPPTALLEVGCAAGDFLHWIVQRYPNACVTGVDLHPALLEAAARRVPEANFAVGDLEDASTLPDRCFDAVFMHTVHSHFDDCGAWFDHLVDLVAPGGHLFMYGIFNPQHVDVMVRARYSGDSGEWLPGWSVLSRRTVELALARNGWIGHFIPFTPRHPILRREDPLAAWTEERPDGSLAIRNGLCQELHFALLEARAG